jgi:hypothetical protein
MARSRSAVMGASCLLVLAATAGSAAAQTATGAPLPLLQIDHARTAAHARHRAAPRIARTTSRDRTDHRHIARRVHAKTRVADAAHDLPAPPATPPQTTPPQTGPHNGSQTVWSAPAVAGNVGAPAASPDNGAAAVTTEQVVDTSPNGILNGSHTVPAAMPAPPPAPVTPVASAPSAQPAATSPSPPVKVASAAAPKLAAHAMLFRPSSPSPIGSARWIAQLLAALGGAIAAGAVAWLLIRPKPERMYG